MHRRSLLRVAAAGFAASAGCSASDPDAAPTTSRDPATTRALPYRDADPAANLASPRGLVVANRSGESQYLTVTVLAGEALVYTRSLELAAADTLRAPAVVARRGVYDVVVETEAGHGTRGEWVVADGFSDLSVTVADGVALDQTATCDPSCPPVTAPDVPASLPYVGDGDLLHLTGTLRLTALADVTADLALGHGEDRFLEATYDLPASVTLEIPAVATAGTYTVDVTHDGSSAGFRWSLPGMPRPTLELGAAASFSCGERDDVLRLRNTDDVAHVATISVTEGPVRQFEREVRVPAGGRRRVATGLTDPSGYRLRVSVADGETAVVPWTPCPPHRNEIRLHSVGVEIRSAGE